MHDDFGESHLGSALDTPLTPEAFLLTDDQKIKKIEHHFTQIMQTLGLDLSDDSLAGTPSRVAKMYVREIFQGLNPANKPAATIFDNKFHYKNLLVEKNIPLQSTCEHHFLPIIGVAHVAYIPNGHVIGLSKLNRIVDYYARRPQVQERLTRQIAEELRQVLHTEDVAVYIDARHMCVEARGIKHHHCSTATSEFSGKFLNENTQAAFFQALTLKPEAHGH